VKAMSVSCIHYPTSLPQADVHINVNSIIGAWINPAILGHNIYSPSHASIKIKGEWYHWSFDKKDFVKD
jgi:hypothetical protein